MKLIHTADWHLGKRLQGFALGEQQREALAGLLAVVDEEQPEAVVVAGDVFDTPVPPLTALDTWDWFVGELVGERGVPLVAIPGNHDHAERLGLNARIARRSGLHVLNVLGQSHDCVRVGGVEIFGVPFHKPSHVRAAWGEEMTGFDGDYDGAMARVLDRIRGARTPGAPAVVVAHAFVEGAGAEPEGEDAILVGGTGGVRVDTFDGFDYAALGHIHGARSLAGRSETRTTMRYAGSTYACSFSEAGQTKSVDVVEIDSDGVRVRPVPVAVGRRVRVIEGKSFAQVLDEAPRFDARERDDYVLVRVTDTGPLDGPLARLREHYPHALLQQPAITMPAVSARFAGDARTVGVEEAFRAFYRHVHGADIDGLEEDALLEVLGADGDDDADSVDGASTPQRAPA
ncbi:MAG: exonuclease SbcCD subunit D [Trueperaceae bacterium]|nr:exonuclease SbcCD subunit D [Trueperaceae bacterium]